MSQYFKRYGKLYLSGAVVLGILGIIYLFPILNPTNPYAQHLQQAAQPPSSQHLMGTDLYGRDLFVRSMYGGQTTISSTFVLTGASLLVGTIVGLYCGFYDHWLAKVLLRIVDIFLAFPGLIFAIVIASILNQGMSGAVLALALVAWPKYTRLVRGSVLIEMKKSYVEASRMSGMSDAQLLFGNVLPNIIRPVIVTGILDIGTFLMELSSLSFLGLGAKLPTIEWGAMMNEGKRYFQTAPWLIFGPGLLIVIFVASIHLFGDALNDALDPKESRD